MPSKEAIERPDFWKPSVATDIILFNVSPAPESTLRVLLIERGREPFKGKVAFPGGFLDENDQDILACAKRELLEETGLVHANLKLLNVFSDKDRDPRQNRVISASYIGLVFIDQREPKAGDDAAKAGWLPVVNLEPADFAFDHLKIFKEALKWLADRSIEIHESKWHPAESLGWQRYSEILKTK